MSRLLRAGLLTALTDGLFSSAGLSASLSRGVKA
jgi:hypothetical protein